jgi:DNA-binding IclR family transcriptional regulator
MVAVVPYKEILFRNTKLFSTDSAERKRIASLDPHQTASAKRPRNLVQTIERVDQLLRILSQSGEGVRLGALAEAVGLPKGTTHRLLSSLAYFNYVQQDPVSRAYRLGFRLVTLGNYLLDQIDLRKLAQPHLFELARRTQETAHLVVMDRDEALYIDKIQLSTEGLHMSSRVGYRAPLHCTAVGKVLLAHQPDSEVEGVIARKGLPRFTANTLTDSDTFKDHLRKVEADGYAVDNEEHAQGVRCVAAPVRDMAGSVTAAISVSAPAVRVTLAAAQERVSPLVVKTALTISQQLGFS